MVVASYTHETVSKSESKSLPDKSGLTLSIVTTLYQSESFIPEFYNRITLAAEKICTNFEIIFVNDGSPDDSLDVVLTLQKNDPRVVVIDLSRNFGHHKAIMTGLGFAQGEKIFLIDCDLEEAPELLNVFFSELKKLNCDVVYGVQKKRKGRWFERFTGYAYYKVVNYLSNIHLPKNTATVRLMTQRYIKSLLMHQEQEVNIASLWVITGYEQCPIEIVKSSREGTTYSFRKKIAVLINSITAFSAKPLAYIFYSGIFILLFSMIAIIYLISEKIVGNPVSGWASLLVSLWFLGGLTIFFIGVIGIYLSKVFIEVKSRPYTVIRQAYGLNVSQENDEIIK